MERSVLSAVPVLLVIENSQDDQTLLTCALEFTNATGAIEVQFVRDGEKR